MKLLSSPAFLAILAFLLSIGSIGTLVFMNKDALWPPKHVEPPRFPILKFDADVSSFSPQETHAMNELYKELELARKALLKKEKDFSERERLLEAAISDLDHRDAQFERMRKKLEDKIIGHSQSSQKITENEEKNIKKLAATLVEIDPKSAVALIKQYQKDDKIDKIVQVLEYMKPGEIAPIFEEMIQEDDDASTKLAEDIAERLRTLYRAPAAGAN